MVVIHIGITLGSYGQIKKTMYCKECHHMIQKRNISIDAMPAGAVETYA